MPSAASSRGASSTEPRIGTVSTARPSAAKNAAAVRGWAVATRPPSSSETASMRAAGRHGHLERAAPEPERHELVDLGAGLDDLIAAGDGRVDGAVGGPRRDVVGAREQHLDVPARAVRVERTAVDVDLDAGGPRQLERRGVQPPLRRQRQSEGARHGRLVERLRRSSTSR